MSTLETVREILGGIAADADTASLALDAELRDELDLDSMDFLNFVTALAEQFAIDIPEPDYPQLATLAGCATYVDARR